MKQCPICDIELIEPVPPFCNQCGWDLKNDLTLVPVIEEYTQRYRAAKRVWNERLEALKRQEEWERRFTELEAKVKDSAVIRQDGLEKRFAKLESAQSDVVNRLKFIEEAVKEIIPPPAGTLWTEPLTGMEFVYVPAGIFMMGDVLGDNHYDNEKPVHEVKLDGFYIGKYPAIISQWNQFISGTGYKGDGKNAWRCKGMAVPENISQNERHPAVCISWNEAKAFAKWLSGKTGKNFRLPTEAEWEYAARSGGKQERYAGGNDADTVAWHSGNSGGSTHPVGQKRANGLGIYDMSGNVWEWCEDIYDSDAYTKHQRKNPIYTGSGSSRVLRGGSWGSRPVGVRCADRRYGAPARRSYRAGFRLVRTF